MENEEEMMFGLELLSTVATFVAKNEAVLGQDLKGLCETKPNPTSCLHAKSATLLSFKLVKRQVVDEENNIVKCCPDESGTGIDWLGQEVAKDHICGEESVIKSKKRMMMMKRQMGMEWGTPIDQIPKKRRSVMERKLNRIVSLIGVDLAEVKRSKSVKKGKHFTCKTNGEEDQEARKLKSKPSTATMPEEYKTVIQNMGGRGIVLVFENVYLQLI